MRDKRSPFTIETNGELSWDEEPGDRYEVTGTDIYGRRFSQSYTNWRHANGISLYRGTKWLKRDGKRYRIMTVSN